MRTFALSLVFLLFLFGLRPVAAVDATLPAREAFGLTPRMEHASISPDGRRLAWTDNTAVTPHVVMFDTETGRTRPLADLGAKFKPRGLAWADDETVLIDASVTHTLARTNFEADTFEMFRTLSVSTRGGPARMLLLDDPKREWVTGAWLLALHTAQPDKLIMSTWDYNATSAEMQTGSRLHGGRRDSGWVHNVYAVDARTGKGKIIEGGNAHTEQWVVDPDGVPQARADWVPEKKQYRLFVRDAKGWRLILERQHNDIALQGLSADRSAIIALGALDESRSKVWLLPLDGSAHRVLREDATFDIEAVLTDPYTMQPAGFQIGGAEQRHEWFDPQLQQHTKSLERSFPGKRVWISSRSSDGNRVVAEVNSASAPTVYYLVDFAAKKADIIGEQYPGLAEAPLGEVRVFEYAARDGAAIPAYLTLPPGKKSENLPLVVLPHGGPEARDHHDFDWLPQFLASRGYAVFQPQFRGSTGFGEAHRRAGYGQWGGIMQHDVTDGVKALIDERVVDARRVCIVGVSYGGYAALAGAAFTPELYACAVSMNGVSDLPAALGDVKIRYGEESGALAYWDEHIGSKFDQKVIDASPSRAALRVAAPVLLIHGRSDSIVPIHQSRLMAQALQNAGKEFTSIELDGEDHWLSRSETRLRALAELEEFLAKHL